MEHFSWKNYKINDVFNILKQHQTQYIKKNKIFSELVESFQNDLVPVINLEKIDIFCPKNQKIIYNLFFLQRGCLIFKNLYSPNLMNQFNLWCSSILEAVKNDKNCTHPKQKDKWLINDLIKRLVNDKPEMLIDILFDNKLNQIMDIILGFGTFGSATGHWINPGGKRQLSHVDYPIHVGSGAFWEHSVNKLKRLSTQHQINNILPHFSFQLLIAADKMDISNGSTEVVPCSHLLPDMDLIIHNPKIYSQFEEHFMNVTLEQGDLLIFNRRLCHRGGENISDFRRNALIIQSVYLWGVGQEIIDSSYIINKLEQNQKYLDFSEDKKKDIKLRLKKPYPIDVKNSA